TDVLDGAARKINSEPERTTPSPPRRFSLDRIKQCLIVVGIACGLLRIVLGSALAEVFRNLRAEAKAAGRMLIRRVRSFRGQPSRAAISRLVILLPFLLAAWAAFADIPSAAAENLEATDWIRQRAATADTFRNVPFVYLA